MHSGLARLWQTLREALRGEAVDHTSGSLDHSLLLLAIPMILETAMESLFAIVDIFFVSKLGEDAMATVALTESLVVLVIAVALGLSFSTTAFVARRIGEKNPVEAARGEHSAHAFPPSSLAVFASRPSRARLVKIR